MHLMTDMSCAITTTPATSPAGATTTTPAPAITIAATAGQGSSFAAGSREAERAALRCGPFLRIVASRPPAEGDSKDRPHRDRVSADADGPSFNLAGEGDRWRVRYPPARKSASTAPHQARSVQASKFGLVSKAVEFRCATAILALLQMRCKHVRCRRFRPMALQRCAHKRTAHCGILRRPGSR